MNFQLTTWPFTNREFNIELQLPAVSRVVHDLQK